MALPTINRLTEIREDLSDALRRVVVDNAALSEETWAPEDVEVEWPLPFAHLDGETPTDGSAQSD